MSSFDTLKCMISIADCERKQEAGELKFLRSGVPKNAHCLNLFSSSSLYLSTQTSIPCATLAKSLFSTFICKYSKISGGSVTVTYGLRFPFSFVITCNNLYKSLYCSIFLQIITSEKLVGTPTYDKIKSISESCRAGDHNTDNSRMHREHISDVGHSCLRLVGYSGRSQRRDNLDRQQMRDPDLRPHSGSLQLIEVA